MCPWYIDSIYSKDTLRSVYQEQCIYKILYIYIYLFVCWKIKRENITYIECD